MRFLFLLVALAACAPVGANTNPATPAPRLPGLTTSQTVVLAGERVYFETGGPAGGSPVVFVHGIGAGNSSHLYRNNTAAFAKKHRVYAFDLPGFARSGARPILYTNDLYVRVLEAFLREVVREPAAIVAGSLGADYAIRVAQEHPALVSKLVLSNPTGYDDGLSFTSDTGPRPETFKLFTETPVGALTFSAVKSEGGINFFLYGSVYLDTRLVTPEVTRLFLENLEGPFKEYAPFSFFSGFLDQSVRATWPQTKQPALLFWGSDDVFTPVKFAQDFIKARPDVELWVLRARAIPYEEQAARFNFLVLQFLSK